MAEAPKMDGGADDLDGVTGCPKADPAAAFLLSSVLGPGGVVVAWLLPNPAVMGGLGVPAKAAKPPPAPPLLAA